MATSKSTGTRRDQAAAVIDALDARDFEALDRMPFDPEMEFRSALAASEGGTYRGRSAFRRWAADVDAVWAGLRTELVEFHEVDGERAVAVIRLTGTARASGVPLDVCVGQVWTWRAGLMLRNVVYTDPREAFEAVGLR